MPDLRDHTTLRLGGPAKAWVRAETEAELIEAVSAADAAGEPVLVLGGGSNVVVADEGFPGRSWRWRPAGSPLTSTTTSTPPARARRSRSRPASRGTRSSRWPSSAGGRASRRWPASPGYVGATPIQNVGAYGQEVSQTIATVRVWDRKLRGVRTFAAADCGFGYRTSRFKQDPGRHVVLDVTFQLPPRDVRRPAGVRRARPHPQPRGRPAGAHRVGARGRARPAHPQGHGPRPRRPRHLVGRLVLHQPGRRARRGAGGRPGLAAARRRGEDERGLADRARGVRQGVRERLGVASPPSTPWR